MVGRGGVLGGGGRGEVQDVETRDGGGVSLFRGLMCVEGVMCIPGFCGFLTGGLYEGSVSRTSIQFANVSTLFCLAFFRVRMGWTGGVASCCGSAPEDCVTICPHWLWVVGGSDHGVVVGP